MAYGQIVDEYFGYDVEDHSRYLEDVRSAQTKNWVESQLIESRKYLRKCVRETNAFNQIDRYAVTKFEYASKQGKYFFNLYRQSSIDDPALYCKTDFDGRPQLVFDPSRIDKDDQISISGFSISKDNQLLAVQYSRNGSDWTEIQVVNLPYGEHTKDHLIGVKYSNIAWRGDGFYYATVNQEGSFGAVKQHRIMYHQLGTPQEEDKLIYENRAGSIVTLEFSISSDERYFFVREVNDTKGRYNIFYVDHHSGIDKIRPLLYNLRKSIWVVDSNGDKIIAQTSHQSDNGSILLIDPTNPLKWEVIAPPFEQAILLRVIPYEGRIVAIYQQDQQPILSVLSYEGEELYSLPHPKGSSIAGFTGDFDDQEVYYYFKSYTVPPIVYKFNLQSFRRELVTNTSVAFDHETYVHKHETYPSNDGTDIPLTIIYKEGIELNGQNPTLLKAYGGFGVINQPSFDPGLIHFLESGGVFAFANIRGGGDMGKGWAAAGRGANKQQSFDDFIAAAEYMIDEKYTSGDKLAITGTSNGGLVAAVAAIQRPELFRAAVPIVAPLDMIRFEQFTVGQFHLDEYGTATDSLSFLRLKSYSPYHNVKGDINYPSMLVITAENDDRVPPFHSYKFVNALQNRPIQSNPILLSVDEQAGHYGGRRFYSQIERRADLYGFILSELMD